MSAWMVSNAHIDLLATAWTQLIDPAADPQEIGQQLAHDNAASIEHRYGGQEGRPDLDKWVSECKQQAFTYRFDRWPGNIDPEFLAKQVACYRYQSCEGDWERRKSYTACERLMGRLVAMGVDWDGEPTNSRRFDDYPWGVDEEHRNGGAISSAPEAVIVVFRDQPRLF